MPRQDDNREGTHKRGGIKVQKFLKRRIPILKWFPNYNAEDFLADCIAGLTVALTVIPQSLAYATLAGLQPQYGLYSSFIGCFIYTLFGSCKDITIGPTALMALMTYQQVSGRNLDFAILLCFLSGVVQLIMASLNLGVLIDFISIPVTVGFTSATSVIIATSQLKGLLGLKFKSSGFLSTIKMVIKNFHQIRYSDLTLGLISLTLLLSLRALKNCQTNKKAQKCMWLISISRNAIVVIGSASIAFFYESYFQKGDNYLFILTGKVQSGLPVFHMPPFSTTLPGSNSTIGFYEMCSHLGSSIFLVPIIGVLGNVAIGKAFTSGVSIDATQELLTLSLCNIVGSFFSSMPVTGSFSRSAVNHSSGVRTPFGGIYTGLVVILALNVLTPYFYYIPKAALAAVIISAVIFMIEYEVLAPMWRSKRKDLIPTIVTFLACLLLGVEIGIVIGIVINILFLLYSSARPSLNIEKYKTNSGCDYLLITPTNNLYFPAIDFVRTTVGKASIDKEYNSLPVVINCKNITDSDFTVAKGISAIASDFQKQNKPLYFVNPSVQILKIFRNVSTFNINYIQNAEELDEVITILNKNDNQKEISTNDCNQNVIINETESCI